MSAAAYSLLEGEYARRHDAMRAELARRGLDGLVAFSVQRVFYLSGFAHVPTERPVAFVLPLAGEPAMLIPRLEEEHVGARLPWLREIRVYPEYPGIKHPMVYLGELLAERGLAGRPLGADSDGYGDQMGYRGPALSTIVGRAVTIVREQIDALRLVKSDAELGLLRLAGQWAVYAHRLLQEQMVAGRSETAISRQAEWHAADRLAETLARQGHLGGAASVHVSFRSGPRTAMPHALMGNRPIEPGDNLVSYCLGSAGGYHAELERTMFLGQPSERQRELFEAVLEAQQIALETIRPGVRCAEVEDRVRGYLVSRGYEPFIRHHTGHGLGLEYHEPPFLDLGDETVLRPGMVFSVEPGLYVPGLGGFRHSDTVALREDGVEVLTEYPRRLDDLVIPA